MVDGLVADLRIAARSLRREWRFAAIAILTLALGIGPNTAIFSIVHTLLLRPLPFPNADQLVRLEAQRGGEFAQLSYREVRDMRERLSAYFSGVAAYTDQGQYNASGDGRPEELVSTITTHDLFAVLGTPIAIGEPWPEVLDRSRDFKVVISHGLWQRRFGGRRDILGTSMTLDGAPGYTVVGVTPPGFAFPLRADVYRSNGIAPEPSAYEDRGARSRWGLGRLKDGVTIAQVQLALAGLATDLAREFPATNTGITYRVVPVRDLYVGNARPYLLLILAAVALVLLVACSNVANLLLTRALGREREVSVRLALGARRRVVLRGLLVESVVLATLAAIIGVGLGWLSLRALTALIRLDMPLWLSFELSTASILFTALVSLAAGVLAGLAPGFTAGRGDLTTQLKDGGRGASASRGQQRVRGGLVVGQVAMATMLMVGAGLLLRSFDALVGTSPGFRTDSLLTFRVELGWRAYPGLATKARFTRALTADLATLPGVTGVGIIGNLPLDGRPRSDTPVFMAGQTSEAQRENPFLNVRAVTHGTLDLLGIALRGGSPFAATDHDTAGPRVALVSEATARRLWPGRDPIGQRLLLGGTDSTRTPWRTIVGVVGDVRHEALSGGPALDVYVPMEQYDSGGLYVLMRSRGDLQALARTAPPRVWSIDPNQSFFDVRTMDARVADRVWVPRLASTMFAAFGLLTAILAAIGVSAVLAYVVSARAREFGVRQALGATPGSLSRNVVRDGVRLVLTGGGIGAAVAGLGAFAGRHLLFGVSAVDIPTVLGVVACLLVLALAATWLPARHATRVSPMEALRS